MKFLLKNKVYLLIFIISLLTFSFIFNQLMNQTIKEVDEKNKKLNIKEIKESNNVINEIKKPIQTESNYYIITSNTLNIRKLNNINSECIGLLYKDDIIEVVDKNNEWYKIKDKGFVNKNFIRVIDIETVKRQKNSSRSLFIRRPINIVNSVSNLHIDDLKNLLSETKLEGIEDAIIQVEKQYGINAFFVLAVARLESGNGTSKIAINKNNLFGLNAIDRDPYNKAFTFKNKSESVYCFANTIKHYYIDKGLKDITQINKKYSSSNNWSVNVNRIMLHDYQKIIN